MTTEQENQALGQFGAASAGAALGALTHHTCSSGHGRGAFAIQLGSAMGAAAATGGGLSGSVAAGTALVTAKVAAVSALGAAATAAVAPIAIVGGAGYGLYLLAKKLTR